MSILAQTALIIFAALVAIGWTSLPGLHVYNVVIMLYAALSVAGIAEGLPVGLCVSAVAAILAAGPD